MHILDRELIKYGKSCTSGFVIEPSLAIPPARTVTKLAAEIAKKYEYEFNDKNRTFSMAVCYVATTD